MLSALRRGSSLLLLLPLLSSFLLTWGSPVKPRTLNVPNRCRNTYDLTETLVLVDKLLQRQVLDDVGLGQRALLVLFVGEPASRDNK